MVKISRRKNTVSACQLVALSLVLGVIGACSSGGPLEKRYITDRANYGDRALPNPGDEKPLTIVNPDPTGVGTPEIVARVTGTWTFTAPRTTTTVERKNQTASRFTIYNGRPGPEALPMVVIDVSPLDPAGWAPDPKHYNVTGKRTFELNGNPAIEWTGTKVGGGEFTALTISRPTAGGDHCYALATPGSAEEQKICEGILGSIVWKGRP